MNPFLWQGQVLCLLNLAFIIDWIVVNVPTQNKTIFSEKWRKRINPSYVSNGVCMQVPPNLVCDMQLCCKVKLPIPQCQFYSHLLLACSKYTNVLHRLRRFAQTYIQSSIYNTQLGADTFSFLSTDVFPYHVSNVHFLFLWYGLFALHFLKYNSLF